MEKVTVLMSTYNGENYLIEQINSVLNQKDVEIQLIVRDDGSGDDTISILEEYEKLGKLTLIKGNNHGYIKSFMELIKNCGNSEYYALCDQDDVWDEDKLCRSLFFLSQNSLIPSLYCSNARLVDVNLQFIKNENKSPIVSLESAMIKNFATGCTVIYNKKLREYINLANDDIYISSHDSWLCRVCLAVGGNVFFDSESHINYRQHGKNCVGAPSTKIDLIRSRFLKLVNNREHSRRKTADNLIKYYDEYLSDTDRQFILLVSNYHCSLKSKIKLLLMRNISCGNKNDDIQFKIAVLFNWV